VALIETDEARGGGRSTHFTVGHSVMLVKDEPGDAPPPADVGP
jgi:hypothetical protein